MARRYRGSNGWDRLGRDPNVQRLLGFLLGLGVQASQRIKKEHQNRQYQRPIVQKEEPKQNLPQLYGTTGGKTAVGILKTVAGGILAGPGILLTLAGLVLSFTGQGVGGLLTALAILAGSAGLISSGVSDLNLVSRFRKYCAILGQKTHCSLEQLARSVGKQESFVRRDVKKLIRRGFFLEGHMDQEEATLITSHETYRHFEESRRRFEEQKRLEAQEQAAAQQRAQEEAARKQAQSAARDPKVQAVLNQGEAFLAQIRRCNDAIPGQVISAKISRMELIIQKIFHRLEMDPDVVDDLKKLMDYYLPMTVKLLNAYADMDAQPVQGETITASKREIEESLDMLNQAFERLLDSIFQETALDVSSDISVLQTLLAQEGLTEDPLQQIRKQNQ